MIRAGFLHRSLQKLTVLTWSALVVMLLFTSFPLVAALVRTDQVAPPADLLAALLFAIWLVPEVLRGRRFPFLTGAFLAVVSVIVVVTFASFFLPIMPVKGRLPASEVLDALITLGVAVIVYLVAATFPDTEKRLKSTLQLLNVTGLILIVWSVVQAYFIYAAAGEFPEWMWEMQSWFSIRILFKTRVTGFAYEPSWLAHQLNVVFLPYWLAASVKGYSVHSARIRKVTAENLLLLGGVGVLLLSFSRIGWLSFGLAFSLVVLQLTGRITRALRDRLFQGRTAGPAVVQATHALIFSMFIVGYLAAGLGALQIASRFDPRLSRLFEAMVDSRGFYPFTNQLAFAERTVAWGAGWEIFNEYPLSGVGLGNAGFFFNEELPPFGWLLFEINQVYFREPYLFNTKNLWTRLLAEGGIITFAFLLGWLYLVWKSARTMQTSPSPLLSTLGSTGVFYLLILSIEGFSIDSFAMPYIWFTAGLITAATHIFLTRDSG